MASDILQKVAHKFHCDYCYYSTSKTHDYNKHLLTLKHKMTVQNASLAINGNLNNASHVAAYNCDICNFYSKNKTNYDKHLLTEKHINKIKGEPKNTKHICYQCNKEYSIYNSLWKHKKHCVVIKEREPEPLENKFIPGNLINSELLWKFLEKVKSYNRFSLNKTKSYKISCWKKKINCWNKMNNIIKKS